MVEHLNFSFRLLHQITCLIDGVEFGYFGLRSLWDRDSSSLLNPNSFDPQSVFINLSEVIRYLAFHAKKLITLILGDFMKLNVKTHVSTHEGGKAISTNAYETLRRTILACMLFEDNFYEDGKKAVDRIVELCAQCSCIQVLMLALDAHLKYHLRHVPLQMIVEALKLDKKPSCFADTICSIITRPDQMTDLLALYWRDGKKPLANQLKKGLALSFKKWDRYQLAKYNRKDAIKLRDVLFLCHAKPLNDQQTQDWKDLINDKLEAPDTWEVRLSSGADKKESFQELLESKKMGKLAILRNMRNMKEAGVPKDLVASELMRNMKEMLPFQYISAAKECPEWEDIIDPAMIAACALKPKLEGKTVVIVDVSGSMDQAMSSKSKMTRLDSACAMAILLRECVTDPVFFSFSEGLVPIPNRKGIALRDAIVCSQPHGATYLGKVLNHLLQTRNSYDRLIIITDEQCQDDIPNMPKGKNYILNIAGYQNGIGNRNQWTTITGFSEASIDFIRELETQTND